MSINPKIKFSTVPGERPSALLAGEFAVNVANGVPSLFFGGPNSEILTLPGVAIGTKRPPNPFYATLFINENNDSLEYWSGNSWIPLAGKTTGGGGGGSGATTAEITQPSHGFASLDAVYFDGSDWLKAQANNTDTLASGIVVDVIDPNTFVYAQAGRFEVATTGLVPGNYYYLSETVAGGLSIDEPPLSQPIVFVETDTTIIVTPYRPFTQGQEAATTATWGFITGDINDQTDLQQQFLTKTSQTDFDLHVGNTNIHFTDAPNDGQQYVRQSLGWSIASPGVTDHGALTGLADDDHLQYLTNARGDARYPSLASFNSHVSDASIHFADAPNDGQQYIRQSLGWVLLPAAGAVSWGDIVGTLSNQTDLQNALNAKTNQTDFTAHTGNASIHFPDAASDGGRYLRQNGAWLDLPTFTGPGTDGVVPDPVNATARFLRDDGSWSQPPVSPIGGVFLNMRFSSDTDTSVDPGSGIIRLNAGGDHQAATEMAASIFTTPGNEARVIWDNLKEGDFFGLWESTGDRESITFRVQGPPVDNGTWVQIPIVAIPGQTNTGIDNNSAIQVFFITNPARYLPVGGLTGQVLTKFSDADYAADWETPSGGGGSTEAQITQVAHGFVPFDAVRNDNGTWIKALSDDVDTIALGVVVEVIDADNFKWAQAGRFTITAHGLTPGLWYYLSDVTPGGLVTDQPEISQPLVYVEDANTVEVIHYRPFATGSAGGGLPVGATGQMLVYGASAWEATSTIRIDALNRVGINKDPEFSDFESYGTLGVVAKSLAAMSSSGVYAFDYASGSSFGAFELQRHGAQATGNLTYSPGLPAANAAVLQALNASVLNISVNGATPIVLSNNGLERLTIDQNGTQTTTSSVANALHVASTQANAYTRWFGASTTLSPYIGAEADDLF